MNDDDDFYAAESEQAHAAAPVYLPETLRPRYAGYFARIMNRLENSN